MRKIATNIHNRLEGRVTKKDINDIIDALIAEIVDEVENNGRCAISGLGVFYKKKTTRAVKLNGKNYDVDVARLSMRRGAKLSK